MDLNFFQTVQGICALIFVIFTFILALIIIIKYFEFKDFKLLLVGTAIIGLSMPYVPDSIMFFIIVSTQGNLSDAYYLETLIILVAVTTFISSISVFCWVYAIAEFIGLDKTKEKKVLLLYTVAMIVFFVLYFTFLIIDIRVVTYFHGPFDYQWGLLAIIYFITVLFILLIGALIFVGIAIKTQNPEAKLKAKFLLIGSVSYIIATILPFFVYTIEMLIISRIILIICSILIYIGFILPDSLKKRWLKQT